MIHNRYPGAKPFPVDYRNVFFGREQEIRDLLRIVRREPWLVLYGKSGLGKSSLLNAGLAPRLNIEDAMSSIFVRFSAWTPERLDKPLGITVEILEAGIPKMPEWLENLLPGDQSLWRALKNRQLAGADTGALLLIFDQFEELFTFPVLAVEAFARSLAEVFYTDIPERYRLAIEHNAVTLPEAYLRRLHEPLALRVVTAIRTDRMALMHQLKPFLPNTLDLCYELRPLSRTAAEEAVLNPAYDPGEFVTPRFDYDDDSLDALLDFLSANETQDVESFQLQILCEYLEKNVVERAGRTRIIAADIGDPERILEDYYLNKIEEIPDSDSRLAARHLIEEGLIFEEEERRLTLFEGQIYRVWGVDAELLARLENTHLLRREPSLRGGYTYELSHDTLVAPVLKAKNKRTTDERSKQEAETARLRETELATAKAEAAREKRRRQRSTILALGAAIAALVAFSAAGWAWQQTMIAQQAQYTSEAAKAEAVAARETAERNLYALQQEQAKALEVRGDNFFQYLEYGLAKYEYEQALLLLPENADKRMLKDKIEECKRKLNDK